MNEVTIERVKRFLAVLVGIGLIYISILFSNRGFNFQVNGDDSLVGIGYFLAISITVIELVFNGQLVYKSKNLTLYSIGLLAYGYGILTNIIGFWDAQGIIIRDISDVMSMGGWFGILMGLFFEVSAEPLIVYGLIGVSNTQGDMVGALLNNWNGNRPKPLIANNKSEPQKAMNNNQQGKNNNHQYQPQHKPQHLQPPRREERLEPAYRPVVNPYFSGDDERYVDERSRNAAKPEDVSKRPMPRPRYE